MRVAQPVLLDAAVHGIGHPRQNAEPGDDVAVGVQEVVEGSEDRDSREREHGQNPVSCPRFLWTPYCPEKLEDDSVEGDGKTMIDVAGVVGSEGERSSSMPSITGQGAGAG